MGGPTSVYHVALARLKLQKKALDEANESLNQALILNIQVGQVSVLLVWCFVILFNHIQILTTLGGMAQIISPKLSQNNAIWPMGACAEGQAGFWSYHRLWFEAIPWLLTLIVYMYDQAVYDAYQN